MSRIRLVLPLVAALSGSAVSAVAATRPPEPSSRAGESIFRRGELGSGEAVEARSAAAGVPLLGAAAACANCHRRSGLGGKEGRYVVPPVTGRYLYRPRGGGADSHVPFVEGIRGDREPYTDATLARAIREGVDSEGRPLDSLMPRYPNLGDDDMEALIRHLKGLDPARVPGVSGGTLHFATIVTPDADPGKRRAMLAVLEQFFAERNARQMSPAPSVRAKHAFMAHRFWQLHVWELTGPESTWRDQLWRRLREEPVFAVVSGLGGGSWAPVHAFCEEAAVPCLFPNVEAPVDAERDFYTVYFSRGVLLEARLIADAVGDRSGPPPVVRQVFRTGDVGEAAARALAAALAQHGVRVADAVVDAAAPAAEVARAVGAAPADVLVLWLRGADLQALGEPPPDSAAVYASGLMGGLERAPLAPVWRERTRLAYPFDLPDKRRVRMDFAFGWFRIRKIPIEAEQVQADTHLACGLLSETLNHMSDTFIRDYLIERIEDALTHRLLTGYYPRLSLAPGQRFASKGGYLVRFADRTGPRLVAEGDWIVP